MTTKKFSISNLINLLRNMLNKKSTAKELNSRKIDIRDYKKPYQWPKKNIRPQQQSKTPLNEHAWTEE